MLHRNDPYSMARVQEKWMPVFRPHARQTYGFDHVLLPLINDLK
jgi:hypothetical protein